MALSQRELLAEAWELYFKGLIGFSTYKSILSNYQQQLVTEPTPIYDHLLREHPRVCAIRNQIHEETSAKIRAQPIGPRGNRNWNAIAPKLGVL